MAWGACGVSLCTATGSQGSAAIVSDGAGGAIVAWADSRSGIDDIYARRITAAGAPQWTANGVALCTAPSGEDSPAIVSDGAGGAIVTWADPRTFLHDDIYARRVNASGTPQWTVDGVALCTAMDDQLVPRIVSDGTGSAIVVWTDIRAGNADIYAQRVDASGTWGNPAPTLTSVADVPHDQGGFVTVQWTPGNALPPNFYQVYRNDSGTWTWIAAASHDGSAQYSLVVPSYQLGCTPTPLEFQIVAYSFFNPTYESNIMAGASVDNMVPPAPVLVGERVMTPTQVDITLRWNRTAPDHYWWTVYMEDFWFADVYDTTLTTAFSYPIGDVHWKVWAYDIHCNQSPVSNEVLMPAVNTFPGSNVTVTPHDLTTGQAPVKVTFTNVTGTGATWLETTETGPSVPEGFTIGDSRYYNLLTNATVSGEITVCITYDEGALTVPETELLLLHWDTMANPPGWQNITSTLDTRDNVICGVTKSLSPFVIGTVVATAVGNPSTPNAFALHSNVPNPFNPQTTISYDIPASGGNVSISIYDVAGRLVRELVSEHRGAGTWSVQWNGDDAHGGRVASGVYFYRMRAGSFVDTRKMVLLK